MSKKSLNDWLTWQERLHPTSIDLGLARVRDVLRRLGFSRPAPVIVSVGGTNGKGSTVAFLDAILRAAGFRTASYTTPHLIRYNERIVIDGRAASDIEIVSAFERIDRARTSTLTYFEFGTLAALDLIHRAWPDFALLEVGLGGRLDAVNAIDPDISVVTSVGLDHVEWLGPDIESIAHEKAAIYRPGRPAIFGGAHPPESLVRYASEIGADLRYSTQGYSIDTCESGWAFSGRRKSLTGLPRPALAGEHQIHNAACALAVIDALGDHITLDVRQVARALTTVRLPGRFQRIKRHPEIILDVAHNTDAAIALAANLRATSCQGRTLAVVGMLKDKPAAEIVAVLATQIDKWFVAGLPSPRGTPAEALAEKIAHSGCTQLSCFDDVRAGIEAAHREAADTDRIVVFGSFLIVGAALELGYTDHSSVT